MFPFLFLFPFFLSALICPPLRNSVAPYLSGDTFRSHCDHAYDEITRLVPYGVKPGERIFVKGDLLATFFSRYHPLIAAPYILITHNSDEILPGPYGSYLDDPKILAWFTQNLDATSHPKLRPLPIGIENRYWKPNSVLLLMQTREKNFPKTHLLYCNFNPNNYPFERDLVYALFSHASFTYTQDRKPFEEYLHDLASCDFVLAPRGNGLDTHRIWEALYLGAYPIVQTSSLDGLYADLPVVIVSDWREVTEEFLHKKRQEFQQKLFRFEKLWADFWFSEIDQFSKE